MAEKKPPNISLRSYSYKTEKLENIKWWLNQEKGIGRYHPLFTSLYERINEK